MKIVVLFALFIFSLSTYAALTIKPGLWEIEMTTGNAEGKQADPMAEMRKAMAKMSPEQQKQMAAMMGKMGGVAVSPAGAIRVCYTKEMLQNEASLTQQQNKDNKCKTTIKEKSSTKVSVDLKCENGTAGTSVFLINDPSNYTGTVDITDKTGHKSTMTYQGKFASNDCGDVKPLTTVLKERKATKTKMPKP